MLSEGLGLINFVTFLVSVVSFGPSFQPVSIDTAQKILKTSVVVSIKTLPGVNGERGRYGCSGTYISPRQIITAAHCFQNKLPVEFIWARGIDNKIGVPVKLIKLAPEKDLALLEAPYPHAYSKLGPTPQVGQPVMNVGSPLEFEFVVSEGIVAALRHKVRGKVEGQRLTALYTITTAMINSGSSGGGVFNQAGELIGVNTMSVGVFGWMGISMAVSDTDVKEFLK